MNSDFTASRRLAQEAESLLTRLEQVKPFLLQQPAVPAAQISPLAQYAIERYLARGRRDLRNLIQGYLNWLSDTKNRFNPAEAQRRYAILRLKFNAVLTQFDVFADVLTQRSEHDTGLWLSGLDAVADDALSLQGYYQPPPVICYLDRGAGAAIRRARTRLPGGGKNPVAIVRMPRERMIGSGIASSLVHEVGHQAAALLGLIESLRPVLRNRHNQSGGNSVWQYWERWISEILADFWSVARIGVGSTLGLMGVVSLPKAFVFRVNLDDPHPIPWIRVKLSCGIGKALYPHTQWDRLAGLWNTLYPTEGIAPEKQKLLGQLEAGIPEFVGVMINHRSKKLRGRTLAEVMNLATRQPNRMVAYYRNWSTSPDQMYRASPSLAFAVIGQAKLDGRIESQEEGRLLNKLLNHWALHSKLESAASCDVQLTEAA